MSFFHDPKGVNDPDGKNPSLRIGLLQVALDGIIGNYKDIGSTLGSIYECAREIESGYDAILNALSEHLHYSRMISEHLADRLLQYVSLSFLIRPRRQKLLQSSTSVGLPSNGLICP